MSEHTQQKEVHYLKAALSFSSSSSSSFLSFHAFIHLSTNIHLPFHLSVHTSTHSSTSHPPTQLPNLSTMTPPIHLPLISVFPLCHFLNLTRIQGEYSIVLPLRILNLEWSHVHYWIIFVVENSFSFSLSQNLLSFELPLPWLTFSIVSSKTLLSALFFYVTAFLILKTVSWSFWILSPLDNLLPLKGSH